MGEETKVGKELKRGEPNLHSFKEFEHFLNSDSVSFLKLSFSHSSFFILSLCRRGVLKFMCGVSQCPHSQMFTYPFGSIKIFNSSTSELFTSSC